jgi:ubiquinone biosynthesis protein
VAFGTLPAAGVPHPLRDLAARLARVRRYIQLVWVAAHHGLGPIAILRGRPRRSEQAAGRAVRDALQDAGGIFIKFAQALSTRSDLLPAAIAWELSSLQDEVPPVPVDLIRRTLTRELGQPVERLVSHFDDAPLAAASLAQVHRATLRCGAAWSSRSSGGR